LKLEIRKWERGNRKEERENRKVDIEDRKEERGKKTQKINSHRGTGLTKREKTQE